MRTTLVFAQIVISALLIAAILLQQRGGGLSAAFGGDGNVYRTKRGLEKAIFIATIILAVFFFGIALLSIIIV
ncbi:MAG: preprotein translocase subunit SecG [Candidatus Sungbacteria bacterium RIFCSPLOWO2_01_FULL_59_16]|uniref:Protein-export membrane protein SecG n=1 Tax=Candidatus Sungbacteria bacterium RIFCSPLOWO2_01_FULL_59_16 TaxID=1802280 RepID=A0A1G2LEI2_9BACT|nr:MAG: preprotein translocase subunit SecG [Candidatus Sungbacteria bacterium RIFCSPLOWO2_01_FULL_59_16]